MSIALLFLSSNFYQKIRTEIYAIYGLVRLVDEIVDSFHEYNQKELLYKLKAITNLQLNTKSVLTLF